MPEQTSDFAATWSVEGLRTRFTPRNRVSGLFLQVVPWIDAVLVAGLAYFACNRTTITPGILFDLPRASTREGSRSAMPIVMLRVEGEHKPSTLVFFDDERYDLSDRKSELRLGERINEGISRWGVHDLLLMADARIPHGDVIRLVNLARDSGAMRVSVSIKPE